MKKTVTGIFDTPDTAHTAEEKLISHGIDQSALHIDAHECANAVSSESEQGGVASGIRNLFAELLGTKHPEEGLSGTQHHSEIVLEVDVPEDAPLAAVRKTLLDAGALDVHERVDQ